MNTNIVLDASMALAWIYQRSHLEEAARAERLLQEFSRKEIWVPALWYAEVSNALLIGERRGALTELQTSHYLSTLRGLPVHVDNISPEKYYERIIILARQHKLTTYDATYLDLTLRMNAILASFDRKLIEVVSQAGGKIFE